MTLQTRACVARSERKVTKPAQAYILIVNASIITDSGGTCTINDCTNPNPGCPFDPTDQVRFLISDHLVVNHLHDTVQRLHLHARPNVVILPMMTPSWRQNTSVMVQGYTDCLFNFKKSMITSTAVIIIISTFLMGATANLPIVVAPGLGASSPSAIM